MLGKFISQFKIIYLINFMCNVKHNDCKKNGKIDMRNLKLRKLINIKLNNY
jgi:hypothetical protein